VVTTLVLLDRLVTFRTLLGVRPDPTDVLGLCTVLDVPQVHSLALRRTVCFLATSPAPMKPARTTYLARIHTVVLASVFAAVRVWTPLDHGIVVNVGEEKPFIVLDSSLLIAILMKETDGHDSVALVLRTTGLNGNLTVIHLGLQVLWPAILTETMRAIQGNKAVR